MKRKRMNYRISICCVICLMLFDCFLVRELSSVKLQNQQKEIQRKSCLLDEMKFFPIAVAGKTEVSFNFVDSWQLDRSFGGNRKHEGCDIIPSVDQRGVYPVISITDGIVEQMGWLKLGGYRIGVRSLKGNYYYYAHLESYAEDLHIGDSVQAGELLGFMGDSGYGEEGTTGQFVVHLHLGIYVPDENGADCAINPYPYLIELQKKTLKAEY